MKIYVIRHGLTELNRKHLINGHIDEGLAPQGIEQAEEAAPFIPKTVKHIYASPLLRTKQTAEILNAKLGAKLTFHDELKEVDFGLLNGTDWTDEVKKKHRSLKYDWRVHKGESVDEVKSRLLKILKQINAENSDGEALIVTHGGVIRLLHHLECGELLEGLENASLMSFDIDKILNE